MKEFVYPIEEKRKQEDQILIKAGWKSVDEKRRIIWEGLEITIPKTLKRFKELVFIVSTIKEHKIDEYKLELHSHQVECGEDSAYAIITKNELKKWTALDSLKINYAFRGVSIFNTYDLIASMPRIITIKKNEVLIKMGAQKTFSFHKQAGCELVLKGKHPIDQ